MGKARELEARWTKYTDLSYCYMAELPNGQYIYADLSFGGDGLALWEVRYEVPIKGIGSSFSIPTPICSSRADDFNKAKLRIEERVTELKDLLSKDI